MSGLIFNTNDEARAAIEAVGITVQNVTANQLATLHDLIDKRMKESGFYDGTYKMNSRVGLFMTCQTNQWGEREAISFNRDGFIGMAGWADSDNIKPVRAGVSDWLEVAPWIK